MLSLFLLQPQSNSLAGIDLMSSVDSVITRYGDPNDIRIVTFDQRANTISGVPTVSLTGTVQYVSWTYNRKESRIVFTLAPDNRVVQIEVVGQKDESIRTTKNVGLGTPFSQIIRQYGTPDRYEIGRNFVNVRYVDRERLVFRLSKTGSENIYRVVSVVLTAGK